MMKRDWQIIYNAIDNRIKSRVVDQESVLGLVDELTIIKSEIMNLKEGAKV